MNVQVFDTHVKTTNGHYLHFDVLVTPEHAAKAKLYAQQFLLQQGYASEDVQQQSYASEDVQQQSCDFCHNEIAHPSGYCSY